MVIVGDPASVTFTVSVEVHPNKSVTVISYEPAARFAAVHVEVSDVDQL
jgi:hypothetical protein